MSARSNHVSSSSPVDGVAREEAVTRMERRRRELDAEVDHGNRDAQGEGVVYGIDWTDRSSSSSGDLAHVHLLRNTLDVVNGARH